MLKTSYNFVDISVLLKTGRNEYINLTDFSLTGESRKLVLEAEEDLLLTFCAFDRQNLHISGVTVGELFTLADIHNDSFKGQLVSGMDTAFATQISAMLCAKKIMNYNYGRCVKQIREQESEWYMRFSGRNSKTGSGFTLLF